MKVIRRFEITGVKQEIELKDGVSVEVYLDADGNKEIQFGYYDDKTYYLDNSIEDDAFREDTGVSDEEMFDAISFAMDNA